VKKKLNDKISSLIQFIKFGLVGISNTIITAIVIWLLLKTLGASNLVANIGGYAAGLINSFIWNRKWTFESKEKVNKTVFKFMLTFVFSYLLQLGVLYLLLNHLLIDTYWCHLLAMAVYTAANFILNKYYTFKTGKK